MDLSIIIISYNKFHLLEKCLESIYKHIMNISYEIIIVDNNSTEVGIDNIVEKNPNIVLVKNNKNVGFAAANNQGIRIAKGKYCLLLNNDTELIDDKFNDFIAFVKQISGNFVAGCQLLNKDLSKQESTATFPSVWNTFTENFFLYKIFPSSKVFNKYYLNFITIRKPIQVDIVKGAFFFSTTELLKKCNGFDESFFFYSEETDLCYRLTKKFDTRVFFYPNLRVIHYGGGTEGLQSWFHFKYVAIGKIKYFNKHFSNIKYLMFLSLHWTGIILRILYNFFLGVGTIKKSFIIKMWYFIKLLFVYPKNR